MKLATSAFLLAILHFHGSFAFNFTSKCECGVAQNIALRIVGGEFAKKASQPWFAGLIRPNSETHKPFCGGALISDRYVLTAAHCIYNKRPHEFKIALNYYDVDDYNEAQMLHSVSSVQVHELYDNDPKTPKADVGLVRLSEPVNFNRFKKTICLPPKEEIAFKQLTAVGWGRTSRLGTQPDKLKQVSMPPDPDNCILLYGEEFLKDHVCTRDKTSKEWRDVCNGDSGGPLIGSHLGVSYLIGAVSHGFCVGTPAAVFSKVDYYRDWIDKRTQDSLFCEQP